MYNGIGLTTVRGSGTSGHVQTNKFNLNRRLPAKPVNSASDPAQLQGPPQNRANDAILEHNRKREIEKQLLEYEDDLVEKGFGEEEVSERLASRRLDLEAKAQQEDLKDKTAETHELAKRKAREMEKMKAAFGLSDGAKEGEAFDRDLQEKLKAERIAEREAQKEAREEEVRKRAKAAKKAEKERKKAEKRQARDDKKAEARRSKEAEKQRAEQQAKEAERARREAEAKEKRQKDLQARLGPRVDAKQSTSRGHRSSRDAPDSARAERYQPEGQAALERFDPNERYVPREPTPDRYAPYGSPPPDILDLPVPPPRHPGAGVLGSSLSPAPMPQRSDTPSPSPAKVAADRKRPPPPRAPSPERSGPPISPPPRKRGRLESSSISPGPAFRDSEALASAHRHADQEVARSKQIGERLSDRHAERNPEDLRRGEQRNLDRSHGEYRFSRSRRDYEERDRHGRSSREYERYDRRDRYR